MATTLYADTILQEARSMATLENQKKFELRPVISKIAPAFFAGANAAILNLAQIKESSQRVTKVIYNKSKAFTINTTRSNTPTGEQSGTALSTLTWAERNFRVQYNEKVFQNNEVNAMTAYMMNLWNAEKTFWANFDESILLAFLEANKSTVNDGDGYDGTLTSGNMAIAAASVDNFYNIVHSHMMMNDFEPQFQDIHSAYWESKMRYYANQGAGNSTNLSFQFEGFDFYPSNKVTPASSEYVSKHYIIPVGGVGTVTWNNPLNKEGRQQANGRLFTSESLFFPGIFFDVFAYETWGDTSSGGSYEITGDLQDPTIAYEFTLHYANWTQPFTESGMSAIFRYDNQKLVTPDA